MKRTEKIGKERKRDDRIGRKGKVKRRKIRDEKKWEKIKGLERKGK